MVEPLLQVDDLNISFHGRRSVTHAVRGISFAIGREKVGIVGESGSGKSQTGRAILRLTPKGAEITARSLTFDGIDLLAATEPQMRKIRGKRISMILQDPKFSLNPLMRVGQQIVEAYRVHTRAGNAEAATARWPCWRRSISAIRRGSSNCCRTRSQAVWASAS